MREDALNGDPIAKERYEKTLAMRREAYHAKKSDVNNLKNKLCEILGKPKADKAEQAEKGNQEAVRELEESRAIARERSMHLHAFFCSSSLWL